jgi:acetyltransferase-like isoleucine patch superfamily enzyme
VSKLRDKLRWLPWNLGYRWGPLFASRLRRRWVLLRHPHANVQIDPTAYLGPGFSLHIVGTGTFIAGPGCEFRRGFRAEIEGDGRITFGAGCVCTYYVLIQCSTQIEMGERVTFGQSAIVVDGQHRFRDLTMPMLAQGYNYRPIVIGDDVTTTSKCTIMASIGKRTLLGANSVVTRDLPPYCVAFGAPARVIDYYGPPGQEPEELTTPSTP